MSNDEEAAARELPEREPGWREADGSRVFFCDVRGGWLAVRDELIREMGAQAQRQSFARAGYAASETIVTLCRQQAEVQNDASSLERALAILTARGYGDCALDEYRPGEGWAAISVRESMEGWGASQSGISAESACDFLRGLLHGIVAALRRAGGQSSDGFECAETACLANGDSECRFVVGPQTQLQARGYRVGEGSGDSVRQTLLRLNRQMEDVLEAAQKDSLTGIYNRAYFESALRNRIEFANRRTDTLAIAMIDLDRFKSVNDTGGHGVGDQVLRRIARLLAAQARDTDVVARYGGDEFAILMPGTSVEAAIAVANRIQTLVAQTPELAAGEVGPLPLTLSIGLATCPDDAVALPALIELADAAMYRAKENGGNQAVAHVAAAPSVDAPPGWGRRPRVLRAPRRQEVSPAKQRRRPAD